VRLTARDLAPPAAGRLDFSSDVALVRPPVAAAGICLEQVTEEPRVFVLASGHPLSGSSSLRLADVAGLVAAGRGISLCPASSEAFSARPGIAFVPASGVSATSLCVAWRADDLRPAVLAFVKVAAGAVVGGA
jgi:hypothetical protein